MSHTQIINLGDLDVIETRMIMLHRLNLNKGQMAEFCGVTPYHFRRWMKDWRTSQRLQEKLEERYLKRHEIEDK